MKAGCYGVIQIVCSARIVPFLYVFLESAVNIYYSGLTCGGKLMQMTFKLFFFFSMARQPLGGLGRLIFRGFTITHFRHTTVGRTPLDEGPARRRDLYLTTHNTHNRQTSMPPAGFFFLACPGAISL
jgi:hypothetical protein